MKTACSGSTAMSAEAGSNLTISVFKNQLYNIPEVEIYALNA